MSAHSLDLVIDLYIDAEPSRVFNAMTNKVIAMWWGKSYLENDDEATILELEPKVGGKFWERWSHNPNSHDGALLGTVVAIKHPRLIRLQGTFGMYGGEIQGLASFEVSACKSGSDLHFSFKAPGSFDETTRMDYARNWHELVSRLKSFLEHGHAEGILHDPALHKHLDIG
jgi:uncharacterized protein YndB with AHSA1/START domain